MNREPIILRPLLDKYLTGELFGAAFDVPYKSKLGNVAVNMSAKAVVFDTTEDPISHNDYQFTDTQRTPMDTLRKAYDLGRKEGLKFVSILGFSAISENRAFPSPSYRGLFGSRTAHFASLVFLLYSQRFVAAILWRVRLDSGLMRPTLLREELD